MKGLKLTVNGDLSITNRQIDMIEGNELLRQTVQQVLGTNKGEWVFNKDEGINIYNILGKHSPAQPQNKNTAALKEMYKGYVAEINGRNDELAERLQNRLEGVE